jgi:hypothetical protein
MISRFSSRTTSAFSSNSPEAQRTECPSSRSGDRALVILKRTDVGCFSATTNAARRKMSTPDGTVPFPSGNARRTWAFLLPKPGAKLFLRPHAAQNLLANLQRCRPDHRLDPAVLVGCRRHYSCPHAELVGRLPQQLVLDSPLADKSRRFAEPASCCSPLRSRYFELDGKCREQVPSAHASRFQR